jgi:hypothetical protein
MNEAAYGKAKMKKTGVYGWDKSFRDGCASVSDDPHCGQPSTSVKLYIKEFFENTSRSRIMFSKRFQYSSQKFQHAFFRHLITDALTPEEGAKLVGLLPDVPWAYSLFQRIASVLEVKGFSGSEEVTPKEMKVVTETWAAGHAVAQVVIRQLPTSAVRVRPQVKLFEICGGQRSTEAGFLRMLRFPCRSFIPQSSPCIVRGW